MKQNKPTSSLQSRKMHSKWPRYTKNREKLPYGIMGRRHNPPLVRDYFTRGQKQENHRLREGGRLNTGYGDG